MDFRVKNGLAVTNTATIESTIESSSTNTGALTVAGGVGIGGNLYVGGTISATGTVTVTDGLTVTGDSQFLSTTQSNDINSGAVVISGGAGIGKNVNIGGTVKINDLTDSSSTATGAFVVQGGAGFGGDVWIGGTLYGSILGSISTATNIANGTAGQMLYQNDVGDTGFFGPGTAGDLIISNGTSAPAFVGTSSVYVGYSVTATNLNAGATGSLPYQTAEGATDFLSIGSAGQVLTVNVGGTAPQWSSTSSLTVALATTSTNAENAKVSNDVISSAPQYVAFVSTTTGHTGIKGAATAGLVYVPSSASLGIGKVPTTKLDVNGSVRISGITTVTSVVNATTTQTGALQVAGGTGIGGSLFVGNQATVYGTVQSTSTVAGNTLEVYGGVGIDGSLYVNGPTLFENNVTFLGSATYVLSSSTVYTDNIIDLHQVGGGGPWGTDDGLDIGIIFNFYDGEDNNAFFGLENTTKEFVLYHQRVEDIPESPEIDLSTATYATLRLGTLRSYDTTTSVSTDTGALTVVGGVGVGGNLHVGGIIYGVAEVSGTITTATNLLFGSAGQVPYQVSPGQTSFFGPGTAGQFLKSNGSSAPSYVDTATIYVGYSVTATNINFGTAGQLVYQSAPGVTGFVGPGTAGQILISDGTNAPVYTNTVSVYVGFAADADQIKLTNDLASTTPQYITFVSTTTGYTDVKAAALSGLTFIPSTSYLGINKTTPYATLDVAGGIFVSGVSTVTNTTNATSTATGALQVKGGVAVGLDLQVGGSAYISGDETITGNLAVNGGNLTSNQTTFELLNATVDTINFAGAGTAITIGALTGYTDIRNELRVTETTDSSNTSTGALIVSGGVAIKKDLRVGGTVYGLFSGAFTGIATTATNIQAGTAGQTPYQTAPGITSFYGPGTAGQLLISGGTSGPSYVDTSTIYVGYAVTATHLAGGAQGSISYQTAAGRSAFLAIGTNGYVLTSNGTVPSWTSVTGLTAGQADKIRTVNTTGSTVNYITFVDSNNATGAYEDVFTTSSFVINPSTKFVGVGTASPTTNFDLVGAARITGVTTITNTVNATTTSTGALQVAGGAAVGADLVVGGKITGLLDSGEVLSLGNSLVGTDHWITLNSLYGSLEIGRNANTNAYITSNMAVGTFDITHNASKITINNVNQVIIPQNTASVSTTTGALLVEGGIGVGGSVYVKNRVGFVNASNASRVYQYYNSAEDSLDTVFE